IDVSFGSTVVLALVCARNRAEVPVGADGLTGAVNLQPASWSEFFDFPIDRARRRDTAISEVGRRCAEIEREIEPGHGPQRLKLRSKGEDAALPWVVQRLDAKPIARKVECARTGVIGGERKKTIGTGKCTFDSKSRQSLDQNFRIRGTAPSQIELGRHFGSVV